MSILPSIRDEDAIFLILESVPLRIPPLYVQQLLTKPSILYNVIFDLSRKICNISYRFHIFLFVSSVNYSKS